MRNEKNDIGQIELRSEEVQEIMGHVPHWILRWGITVIALVVAGLLAGSWFFRYPDTLSAPVTIMPSAHPMGEALLPPYGIGKIKPGQKVIVRLQNYPDSEFGFVNGEVKSVACLPDKRGLFHVTISFPHGMVTSYGQVVPNTWQLIGTAEIIVKDKRLIENLIHPIGRVLPSKIHG